MAPVNKTDVISLTPAESPTGSATATIEEHMNIIRQALGGISEKLLDEGIEGKYLGPGGQWQEGRLRLILDFTPTPVTQGVVGAVPPAPSK